MKTDKLSDQGCNFLDVRDKMTGFVKGVWWLWAERCNLCQDLFCNITLSEYQPEAAGIFPQGLHCSSFRGCRLRRSTGRIPKPFAPRRHVEPKFRNSTITLSTWVSLQVWLLIQWALKAVYLPDEAVMVDYSQTLLHLTSLTHTHTADRTVFVFPEATSNPRSWPVTWPRWSHFLSLNPKHASA